LLIFCQINYYIFILLIINSTSDYHTLTVCTHAAWAGATEWRPESTFDLVTRQFQLAVHWTWWWHQTTMMHFISCRSWRRRWRSGWCATTWNLDSLNIVGETNPFPLLTNKQDNDSVSIYMLRISF